MSGVSKGYDNGGVNSLERLRCRCRVDEVSGCWLWGMGTLRGLPRVGVAIGEGKHKVMNGRRAALYLSGVVLRSHEVAYPAKECTEDLCVNPEHARRSTRSSMLSARAKVLGQIGKDHMRKMGDSSAAKSRKLTPEQVQEIRLSDEGPTLLGKRYGVSRSVIWAVRAMRVYRPKGFSIFSAANDGRERWAA